MNIVVFVLVYLLCFVQENCVTYVMHSVRISRELNYVINDFIYTC